MHDSFCIDAARGHCTGDQQGSCIAVVQRALLRAAVPAHAGFGKERSGRRHDAAAAAAAGASSMNIYAAQVFLCEFLTQQTSRHCCVHL